MPWWIPFIGAAAMAARAWRADARAWRILSEGLCRQCGYDRKGIAAASRCPECGAAPGA
jgi:predicted Zn-ribbon and HTH transcriptional regulator